MVVERIESCINQVYADWPDIGLSQGSPGFVASGICHELSGCLMRVRLNCMICLHDHTDLN